MRKISPKVQALIDNGDISYFFLIDLELNNNYYLTSLPQDVTFRGNVYTADGGLFEVDSPKFSTVIDREAYKIVIADLNDALMRDFAKGVIGKDITVRVGFLDANKQPLLDEEDVVSVYKGYVDSPVITNNWEEKLAVLEGTSPMADFDSVNVVYTSRNGMKQINKDDTTFDDMFEGVDVAMKWGKK